MRLLVRLQIVQVDAFFLEPIAVGPPLGELVFDFFVRDEPGKVRFRRVVAVEYPRKGIWSIGLVTGDPMRQVQARSDTEFLTVFIPSSPTPFTGYVIAVAAADTMDLNITIEEALRFSVSGGVIVPPSQRLPAGAKTARAGDGTGNDDDQPEQG